jgi:hypothetical protein
MAAIPFARIARQLATQGNIRISKSGHIPYVSSEETGAAPFAATFSFDDVELVDRRR